MKITKTQALLLHDIRYRSSCFANLCVLRGFALKSNLIHYSEPLNLWRHGDELAVDAEWVAIEGDF